jgi:glyoxylase-like metal-dependent hydrolase (beta-lactamase superfamily II)
VHAYLAELDEGGWMLVDGGADTDAAWAVLDAAVRESAGGWEGVRLHLVTHMHVDHIGLAARVRGASGAPLAMGRLDAERAAAAATDPAGEAGYRAGVLREAGAPGRLWRWAEPAPAVAPLPAADLLLEGEGGPLAVSGWRWLPTPGHTAGHVSLLRERDRVLIAGDAVLPGITPTLGVNRQRMDPVADYLDALGRVARAPPATVLPGHGDPIRGPAVPHRVEELRAATSGEGAALLGLLAAGLRSAWELAEARYAGRRLPASAELQALRETLAHLHHLERLGRVRRDVAPDGSARFIALTS